MTSGELQDKHQSLLEAQRQTRAEVGRLMREEEFLTRQLREARNQLRHYEELLADLRRDWGETPALRRILQRLD